MKAKQDSASAEALCSELLSMQARDQAIRDTMTVQCALGARITPDAMKQAEFIDRVNTARMKEIVAKHGWPGHFLVGLEAAAAAILLVLHADRDIPFQKQCLGLLQQAVVSGDALAAHLAFLTDRICENEGRPQCYGTQMKYLGGEWVFADLQDVEGMNRRRAAVGLPELKSFVRDNLTVSGVQ